MIAVSHGAVLPSSEVSSSEAPVSMPVNACSSLQQRESSAQFFTSTSTISTGVMSRAAFTRAMVRCQSVLGAKVLNSARGRP